MFHYVYQITNLVNGKIYVGKHSTENLDDGYMGSGRLLNFAIKKYGIENFRKHIVKMCETSDEAFEFERQIVNEQFVSSENSYNLKIGGEGSWTYVNNNVEARRAKNRRAALAMNTTLWSDPSYRKSASERARSLMKFLHSEGKIHVPDWTGRRHNALTKEKIGKANSIHQTGAGNSQFGTIWIKNDDLKKSTRIKLDELDRYLSEGWTKGRKTKW